MSWHFETSSFLFGRSRKTAMAFFTSIPCSVRLVTTLTVSIISQFHFTNAHTYTNTNTHEISKQKLIKYYKINLITKFIIKHNIPNQNLSNRVFPRGRQANTPAGTRRRHSGRGKRELRHRCRTLSYSAVPSSTARTASASPRPRTGCWGIRRAWPRRRNRGACWSEGARGALRTRRRDESIICH